MKLTCKQDRLPAICHYSTSSSSLRLSTLLLFRNSSIASNSSCCGFTSSASCARASLSQALFPQILGSTPNRVALVPLCPALCPIPQALSYNPFEWFRTPFPGNIVSIFSIALGTRGTSIKPGSGRDSLAHKVAELFLYFLVFICRCLGICKKTI